MHPGRKLPVGEKLFFFAPNGDETFAEPQLTAEIIGRGEFGERRLRFDPVDDFYAILDRIGHMPLPPYIHRADEVTDRDRYQTVFAAERGSAAAPTAGLHFTPEILSTILARGIEIARLTLHVGLGTFQPVRVEMLEDIRLHTERYTLPESTAQAVNLGSTRRTPCDCGGHHHGSHPGTLRKDVGDGRVARPFRETDMFISPGYEFRVVGRVADQFPPAAVDAADAGVRFCRNGKGAGGLQPRGGRGIPFLFLWGLHVPGIKVCRKFCRLEKDGSHVRQTRCVSARHHGLHLSRISRHAAATPYVDAQRYSHGGGLCFCEHAEPAAAKISSRSIWPPFLT